MHADGYKIDLSVISGYITGRRNLYFPEHCSSRSLVPDFIQIHLVISRQTQAHHKALLYDPLETNAHNARLKNDVNFLDSLKPNYKSRERKLTYLTVTWQCPFVLTVRYTFGKRRR